MACLYKPTSIAGEGLVLRPWRVGDEPALVEAFDDPEIARFTESIPLPYSFDHARMWVEELAEAGWRAGGAEFAIDLSDGVAVGGIAIRRADHRETSAGELLCPVGIVGYWVAAPARGDGLAGRALRVLSPWAAEHLGLVDQELVHDLENVASCRTAVAGGFAVDAVLPGGRRYRDGRPRDVERHVLDRGQQALTGGATSD